MLKIQLVINSTADASLDLSFSYRVKDFAANYIDIQVQFACPECISQLGQDTMDVYCSLYG